MSKNRDEDIKTKWALILAKENKNEAQGGRITSYFEEWLQYKSFLLDCKQIQISFEQAEDLWYEINRFANTIIQ